MADFINVCIGIQARSTSQRFPKKVFELIGGKPMLNHVLDACLKSCIYMNTYLHSKKIVVTPVILIPYGDEIKKYARIGKVQIVEGPEDDVLTRYKIMCDQLKPDYILRVTADCPLLPSPLITKAIKTAVMNHSDYCSNVDENTRTAIDGHDVEVVSKRALNWANDHAKPGTSFREHVTSILRTDLIPRDFRIDHIVGYLDQSNLKLSVDTPEDLERVRAYHDQLQRKIEAGKKRSGNNSVHRY